MTKHGEHVKTAGPRMIGISQDTLCAWAEARKFALGRTLASRNCLLFRRDLEPFLAQVARKSKS